MEEKGLRVEIHVALDDDDEWGVFVQVPAWIEHDCHYFHVASFGGDRSAAFDLAEKIKPIFVKSRLLIEEEEDQRVEGA